MRPLLLYLLTRERGEIALNKIQSQSQLARYQSRVRLVRARPHYSHRRAYTSVRRGTEARVVAGRVPAAASK